MEMWQKIVLGAGAVLIVAFVVWGTVSSQREDQELRAADAGNPDAPVIYYYGNTCPNCADVQEFFDENGISYGEEFAKKEIYDNPANRAEMRGRADACNLDPAGIGVPFLWTGEECLIGTPAVTGYFE